MDESVEEIEKMNSEKLGNDYENPVGINGSDESFEVFNDDLSPREKPIAESNNSQSFINESVEKIETLSSEKLSDENPIGINGSDDSLKVFDDTSNSPSFINESVEKIETLSSEKLSDENPIGINGSDDSLKVFDDTSNSPSFINESVEKIETLSSEKLSDENPIGINGSDDSLKVFDDTSNSPSFINESVEKIETLSSEKLSDENPIGINGSDDSLKVFDDTSNSPSFINESVEKIETLSSEKLSDENPIGINGSDDSLKVFDDTSNSPSFINESVEKIETLSSEKLSDENPIGINGSDESLKVFDDDLSPSNSPSFINQSVEEIESSKSEKLGDKDSDNSVRINGSDESVKAFDDGASPRVDSKDDPIVESSNYPSSVGMAKGKGLRKWRRIRRENIKDGSNSADYIKAQKRGLTGAASNPIRGQKSEGSLSSTGAVVRNIGNEANGFVLDTKVDVLGPANSENSISSTGASGSVLRSEKKVVNGVGKGQVKSKKARGVEREKIEKENSITSSLESDSRSSNFMFVKGADSVVNNNGTQFGNSVGENSDDEIVDGEKVVCDGVEDGISQENCGKLGDLADDENHSSERELDPLAESISELQSAQEALEKEIQNLREMGDKCQATMDENSHETSSSNIFNLKRNAENIPHYSKSCVNTEKHNVDVSESKLEESKETNPEDQEIEELLKQKLEAEFQYLAISEAVEKFKIDLMNQATLSDKLKSTLNVAKDAENNVHILNKRAKKLEARIEETIEIEQVPKLQKRVCQVTSFLFIQLTLLFLVFVSYILQLSPHDVGVVPT